MSYCKGPLCVALCAFFLVSCSIHQQSAKITGKVGGEEKPIVQEVQPFQLVVAGDLNGLQSAIEANGFNINEQDDAGQTILMKAASLSKFEIVEYLMSLPDIDVTLKDNQGKDAAAYATDELIRKMILSEPVTTEDLNNRLIAIINDAEATGESDSGLEELQKVIAWGADVNAQLKVGTEILTPLLMAVKAEKELSSYVSELLKQGANASATQVEIDSFGNENDSKISVLMNATSNGYAGTVAVLLNHGADVNALDYEGKTALFYLSQINVEVLPLEVALDIAAKLTQGGADYSISFQNGDYMDHAANYLGCYYSKQIGLYLHGIFDCMQGGGTADSCISAQSVDIAEEDSIDIYEVCK